MTDPKTHRYRQIAGKSPIARLALVYWRTEKSPQPMSIGAGLFAAPDAYFEETQLATIHDGDPVKVRLMGNSQIVTGDVVGIARGINVSNAQPSQQGLAMLNPIFTWVRLAQRVPVRIRLKYVPDDVRLVAGLTATVQVDPRAQPSK